MDNILDQCSIKELILFDVTKPMASSSTIITIAIAAVILNNILHLYTFKNSNKNIYISVFNVAPARACAVGCLVSAVVAGSSLSRERRPSFATPTECEGHRWSLALWSSLRSRTAYALCGDLDSPPRLLTPRVTT